MLIPAATGQYRSAPCS